MLKLVKETARAEYFARLVPGQLVPANKSPPQAADNTEMMRGRTGLRRS